MLTEQEFPKRLAIALESAGLSQSDLARAQIPPVKPQSVQTWVSGRTVPREGRMRRTAEVLGVRYRWLAFGEPPMREGETPKPSAQGVGLTQADWDREVTKLLGSKAAQADRAPPYPGAVTVFYRSQNSIVDLVTCCANETASSVRSSLWTLAVAKALAAMSGVTRLALCLVCTPPGEGHAFIQQAAWEAQPLGVVVQRCESPAEAASAILATL